MIKCLPIQAAIRRHLLAVNRERERQLILTGEVRYSVGNYTVVMKLPKEKIYVPWVRGVV